jgi:N-acyl-D-aspartate/D-glutamate deacylase
MHDLVIRNGRVVDGSGAPMRVCDVAIDGATIAAVGTVAQRGRREIDATGLLVTPGFVDIHTHYDGQATWDPMLTPSSWHGVTTAVFGNCGVGFAPVRSGAAPYLIKLMEGVEDIPETVLAAGVSFDWESFPDYMDALAKMPRVMDVGAQVPHSALRFYVMGERGADHREAPTDAEIARMGELLEASLHAGALGFTTSRTVKHRTLDGRPVPSLSAPERELLGLAQAMRRANAGVLEVNTDFGPGEFEVLQHVAQVSGRPLSCLLIQVDRAPTLWRETLDWIHSARAAGLDVNGQVGVRPIGILIGLETTVMPFATHPAWKAMAGLTPRERYLRLAGDAALRRTLVDALPDDGHRARMRVAAEKCFVLGAGLNYEPDLADSIAARARAAGRDLFELWLELMMADEGKALLLNTFENYTAGDLEVVREMLVDDATVIGVADAGAHVGVLCDGGSPTLLLTHWARDRTRGARLALEALIRKQTHANALAYGLPDRGLLAPGYKADLNVIDFDRLRLTAPEVVYDLPAGGRRLLQRAQGYRHTFVSGVETLRDDEHTGSLPGRLVRGATVTA